MKLNINNTFTLLPHDKVEENYTRQVPDSCFSYVKPSVPKQPSLIHVSEVVAEELGIDKEELSTNEFLNVFSGKSIYHNTKPYAMCYGGHQFGNWAGQLGDGRAINLFEISNNNKQWAVQLKGAGKTPYSRNADGLAVLRSSIREYLCSEAMYYLHVPTTRALSIALTGDMVLRDILYDGHADFEKGAIVTRVAPSFVRFGNFEILAAQRNTNVLQELVDYTIKQFYPEINLESGIDAYLKFYEAVMFKTLDMVIEWQRVGFVHGVMNTDNMSILGLTIDYGPYGWLENYDPNWTPNTTDAERKRYRFGNQSNIAFWNIVQLGNALFPLINDVKAMEHILAKYQLEYAKRHLEMMHRKIGINDITDSSKALVKELKNLLEESDIDYTMFFRELSNFCCKEKLQFIETIKKASYSSNFDQYNESWEQWLSKYTEILLNENDPFRKLKMKKVNPKYVLRNYMAQLAIEAADKGDFSVLNELFEVLKYPYDEQKEYEKWYALRPDWAKQKVGCSQLSCSS